MLADGGDSLGKEAKNWLKRPVGREMKVTSGAGARGGGRPVEPPVPEGSRGQTGSGQEDAGDTRRLAC